MILGIICGLTAALSQCISYIFSKKYIHKDGTAFQLLIASHLIMGIFATICLGILLLENDLPPFKDYWLELLKVDGFYLLAQMSFFMAISKTEASRLAPLLGLKIIFIALFGIILLDSSLNLWQWTAVILCFCGALLSNWSGKSIPLSGGLYLLGAVVGYSLSDISIRQLINCIEVQTGKGVLAVLIAACVSYFYLGIFSLLTILLFRSVKLKHLKPAIGFSCWWFTAMLFLFACFGFIGPLFGNIVQSGRGIIAVILGAVIAKFAWSEHEEKLPRSVLIKRISAASLITCAIIIFALAQK
jgi:drug/metabolite transporter (DMT)-like permease